jgi:hypothetical protein
LNLTSEKERKIMIYPGHDAPKIVSERTANYETVNEYFEEQTGQKQDFSQLVPALVEAWRNALTIEAKDNICRSEIVTQITTPTTLSIVQRLFFQKVTVTVLKVFMSELYDQTGKQEDISIVDNVTFVIGVDPKI